MKLVTSLLLLILGLTPFVAATGGARALRTNDSAEALKRQASVAAHQTRFLATAYKLCLKESSAKKKTCSTKCKAKNNVAKKKLCKAKCKNKKYKKDGKCLSKIDTCSGECFESLAGSACKALCASESGLALKKCENQCFKSSKSDVSVCVDSCAAVASASTTDSPTAASDAPTSDAPTSVAPTGSPTSNAPTSDVPTSDASTESPTSDAPTSEAPTSSTSPTSNAPTSEAPTASASIASYPTCECQPDVITFTLDYASTCTNNTVFPAQNSNIESVSCSDFSETPDQIVEVVISELDASGTEIGRSLIDISNGYDLADGADIVFTSQNLAERRAISVMINASGPAPAYAWLTQQYIVAFSESCSGTPALADGEQVGSTRLGGLEFNCT